MLRVLGGALVLLASGSFGITAGVRYYRASRHLQAFCRAIELLRCEINYSLQPLPEVCALVADRLTGPPAAFFRCFAAQLREPVSRDRAAAAAMEAARGLQLPQDAVMAVLELCSALGRYDLDGENRMLDLTASRLQAALARCEAEKRPRAKCYAALGLCTGLALLLTLAACAAMTVSIVRLAEPVVSFLSELRQLAGLEPALLQPLLRTVGIGLLTQLTASVCADAGESTVARLIELCGSVLGIYTALPLLEAVLSLLRTMLEG